MQIRGIQSADYEPVDQLLESRDQSKKHLGQQAARLRRELSYQPILEIVAEKDGQICGTASMHEITLNGVVCLAMGPIAEKDGQLAPLLTELKQRAVSSGFRFIVWQSVSEVDPCNYGFKPASDHQLYLAGDEKRQKTVYILQLVANSLAGLSGAIEFN